MDARTGKVNGYKGELGDGSDDSEEKDNFRRRIRDITDVVPKPIYSLAQLGKHHTA